MYDKNGLRLTEQSETKNTYFQTAMLMKVRKIAAYAPVRKDKRYNFQMALIGRFDDPRDAAYCAQEFNRLYNRDKCLQMLVDGVFRQVANEFLENLEIPEWEFPAEGLSFEDLEGEGMNGYMFNYVNNARDALKECINKYGFKVPSLSLVKNLEEKVNVFVNEGYTYRDAAFAVMKEVK